jgi:hypothetical protein
MKGIQTIVFWAVIVCSAIAEYRQFRGFCCFHLQGEIWTYGTHHRETTEIKLHQNNMNKEEGFPLSKSWKHLIQTLEKRKAFSREK